jgi:hypothetical protein
MARNAVKQTYNVSSRDVGYTLDAIVTARNSAGKASAYSNRSTTVGRGG